MTIYAAQQRLTDMLSGLYEPREAGNISDWVMEYITGLSKTDRFLNRLSVVTAGQENDYRTISADLQTGRPVQYVLGESWFMGMKFFINESVLIPRPETEELVDWLVQSTDHTIYATDTTVSALDIGTGSGCIAVSLKKKAPHLAVTAIDVSEPALQVARRNAASLGAVINCMQFDFLQEAHWGQLPVFDVIVSNPPYIRQTERSGMARHVTDFEPSVALFVPDNDALVFYRKIAMFSKHHLAKGGYIFLEINEELGNETLHLFTGQGLSAELRKDLQGKHRMIRVTNK